MCRTCSWSSGHWALTAACWKACSDVIEAGVGVVLGFNDTCRAWAKGVDKTRDIIGEETRLLHPERHGSDAFLSICGIRPVDKHPIIGVLLYAGDTCEAIDFQMSCH